MATGGGTVNSLQRGDHQETTHPPLDDATALPVEVVLKAEHMKLGRKISGGAGRGTRSEGMSEFDQST